MSSLYAPVNIHWTKDGRFVSDIFTVSFFGHKEIDKFQVAEDAVNIIVSELIKQKEYVVFLVGREGDSDKIVSTVIKRTQHEITDVNSCHVCVMPYLKKEYLHHFGTLVRYYDQMQLCKAAESKFPKAAIQVRNRNMVARSDLCVFYVADDQGTAWKTMRYAQKNGKKIINIPDIY